MFRIFSSFSIIAFLTTAFFCSCGTSAEISLTPAIHQDDCCDSSKGNTHHSSDKHCDCIVTKMVTADITAKTVLVVPGKIFQQSFILDKSFLNKNITLKHNLAYIHGPPGLIVAVPLYLQFHSLRI